MTEYTLIQKELRELGWAPEQGRGDHIIFRKPGKESIVVSMQVSSASRAYKNCLADIRSKEPDFTLGKPTKKKEAEPKTAEAAIETASCTPVRAAEERQGDKTFIRNHKWIAMGTKAVMSGSPEVTYTVTQIESADNAHVSEESDIVHLRSDTGETTQVFPEDIDSATLQECLVCGQYRPANWYGNWYKTELKRGTCRECLEGDASTTRNETKNETMTDNKTGSSMEIGTNCTEITDKIAERLAGMLFDEASSRITAKGCHSPREYNRKIESDISKMIDKIQVKIKSLDFSKVPSGYMWREIMNRGEILTDNGMQRLALSQEGIDSFLETVDSDKLLDVLLKREDMQINEPKETSLSGVPSQELFNELKSRGFSIVDGKFKRIVEETLE